MSERSHTDNRGSYIYSGLQSVASKIKCCVLAHTICDLKQAVELLLLRANLPEGPHRGATRVTRICANTSNWIVEPRCKETPRRPRGKGKKNLENTHPKRL